MKIILSILLWILFLKLAIRVLPVAIGAFVVVMTFILLMFLLLMLVPIAWVLFFGTEWIIIILLMSLIRKV